MRKSQKSKFDLLVINRVRQIRKEKGYTQDDVAVFLDVSSAFIAMIESPSTNKKYNISHLNRLAWEMECSPKDFMPDDPIDDKFKPVSKRPRKK